MAYWYIWDKSRTLEPYNNKSSIRFIFMCRKVPLQKLTTSDVEFAPSVKIQFTHVIEFSNDMNRGIMTTE